MTDHPPKGAPTGDVAQLPPEPAQRIPYAGPVAGLPPQTGMTTDTAIFTDAYAVIPRTVMRDIVTSYLPGWRGMRMWMLARPLTGLPKPSANTSSNWPKMAAATPPMTTRRSSTRSSSPAVICRSPSTAPTIS